MIGCAELRVSEVNFKMSVALLQSGSAEGTDCVDVRDAKALLEEMSEYLHLPGA